MTLTCTAPPTGPIVVPRALHRLEATPQTTHWGYFDAAMAPALMVDSGDLIHAQALTHHAGDDPALMMDDAMHRVWRETPESDRTPGVHIMTGPIFVRDAKPGDMLEVRYLGMQPRFRFGSNLAAHWGQLYEDLGARERVTIYELDEGANTAQALYAYDVPDKYLIPGRITHCPECDRQRALAGVRVPVRPHLGTAGVAPDETGRVSTVPPGLHGGNIDNWRIGAGATMYYKVQVDGGLFSIGDPHISQGDGEISGTAIEASLDVLFQIILRKDFSFRSPLLETPQNWIVHGFGDTLDIAAKEASRDMLTLLTDRGLSTDDAYSLLSVAGDMAVTQVVDGKQGVHMRIRRDMFPITRT
ncbi:acetamidase/formamidase family protein [Tanticharoenia sakaeratensis]|uniref:Acetamidase/formamidase n=1 Tax=Tanticharoenia sakaeratensis NBRC 103193 TaxID=1231623 RepID=A0A0D6MQ00_9PROT|nr:acetamidase/formamidase family protein [Tanticharoenia sakaeratensis]GAN55767.1 acetamidase/formamidase [Tanticharoenia sakaeratensis NBRC 103193]GBQ18581.1 putative acetamidase [Tanticharoenia sakaeratensis NBRC 103193]